MPASSFEVIVVADGCTDGTPAMCGRLASTVPYALRLIEQTNAGPAAARNRGVREASAELIVFVDDDVVPDARLLETHLAAHAPDASDAIVAVGPLLPPVDQRLNAWGAWEERTLCGHYAAMQAGRFQPTYRQFYTGNASVAKRHMLAAGGFDHAYTRAEDIELGMRLANLGCSFLFLPEARGWHYVYRRFESWAEMPVAYGRAAVTMARANSATVLATTAYEYRLRNAPARLATRLCVGSRRRVAWTTTLLHGVAVAAWAVHLDVLAFASCSLLYNMRLYSGVADELGSMRNFWHLIKTAHRCNGAVADWRFLIVVAGRMLDADKRSEPVEVGTRR